jgi:hypothetical protein
MGEKSMILPLKPIYSAGCQPGISRRMSFKADSRTEFRGCYRRGRPFHLSVSWRGEKPYQNIRKACVIMTLFLKILFPLKKLPLKPGTEFRASVPKAGVSGYFHELRKTASEPAKGVNPQTG